MSGHGASAEADSTAASARCKARSVSNSRARAATCHSRPTCPAAPGYIILGGYWLCLFGGASWSAIDVVHGNLAAPDMIRRRRRSSRRRSGRLYSFVRLSMSLVFGLKMHLASAIAPWQWTAACPQLHNHDIQSKYPSILVAIHISSYPSMVHLQLLCMPVHLPIFLLI